MLRILCVIAVLLGIVPAALAQTAGPIAVASGVTYEFLARWDADKLNRILTTDTPAFAGIPVSYAPARNAVKLYRVRYPSVVPERGNQPTVATGLVAVPDTGGSSFPMVSYQHGTVYGQQQVPSFHDHRDGALRYARLRAPSANVQPLPDVLRHPVRRCGAIRSIAFAGATASSIA